MKIFSLFLLSITITGCASHRFGEVLESRTYELLDSDIFLGEANEIYFKSYYDEKFNNRYIASKQIIISHTNKKLREKGLHLIDSVKNIAKTDLEENKPIVDSIGRKYLVPRIGDFLSQADLDTIARRAYFQVKWDKNKLETLRISKESKASKISIPFFNIDRTIAGIYIEFMNGLELRFFKKNIDNRWEYYCSGTIWRAD